MAKHKDTNKFVKLEHDKCEESLKDFIIVPVGFKYNTELQALRKGDIIQFLDGSEHYVDCTVQVPRHSAIADALCRFRYNISVDKAVEIWKQRIALRKQDVRAMNERECLIIFYYKKEVEYVCR
jgi:hypothetical protein